MAKKMTDASIYWGKYDMAGVCNSIEVNAEAKEVPSTTFGSGGWAEIETTVKTARSRVSGFLPDSSQFSDDFGAEAFALSTAVPLFFSATNPIAEDDVSYGMNGTHHRFMPKGELGDLAQFELSVAGKTPLVRGVCLATETALSGSGNSTGFQAGAVTATSPAHIIICVPSFTGTTMTVTVESDNSGAFSTPTVRGTFTAVTGEVGEYMTITTPAADDYWRIAWSGTFTDVDLVAFFGIG